MDDVMDDLQKELFRAIFAGFAGAADEAALQMAVQLAFGRPRLRTGRRPRGLIARWGVDVHGHRRAPRGRGRHRGLSRPLF